MSSNSDGDQRKIEEYRARERIYLAGLIEQEAELSRLRRTASDVLSTYGDVSRAAVRGALVDPTANMEVSMLRQKAREKDRQISELREELEANRFDQHTLSGQAIMRKCRALLEENKELGEQIREDRIAELRAALQGEQRENLQLEQQCVEASKFCKELSSENDNLLNTISKVASKLREAREELEVCKKEKEEWKKKRKKEKKAAQAAAEGASQQVDPASGLPSGGLDASLAAGGEEALMAVAAAASLGGEDALMAAAATAGTENTKAGSTASPSLPPRPQVGPLATEGAVAPAPVPSPGQGEKVEKHKKKRKKDSTMDAGN